MQVAIIIFNFQLLQTKTTDADRAKDAAWSGADQPAYSRRAGSWRQEDNLAGKIKRRQPKILAISCSHFIRKSLTHNS